MKVIEKAIKNLLDTNPFYAHYFLNSKIEYDRPGIPTAAAGYTKTGTVLIFNTDFVNTLTYQETSGLIEHEILHLLFDHLKHFDKIDKIKDVIDKINEVGLSNQAMDIAINQFISVLPKCALTPEQLEKTIGEKVEKEQNWEYYYHLLIKNKDKLPKSFVTLDEHVDFSEENGKLSESQKRVIQRTAIDKAIKQSKGKVPAQILKIYSDLKDDAKLPWQQMLSNFVSKSVSSTVKNTRKKINRRFGLDQPGKTKKRELTLGVCVDSSGSVSDESYQQFMTEIVRISKICVKTYIVEADCVVQNIEIVKKNKVFDKKRKGCGGTAYGPAIEKCKELKCDAIVYFGDGDCADIPENPTLPFLWVLVGNSPKPGDFGWEIRL